MSAPYPRPTTRPVVHYVPVDSASISPYLRYELAAKRAEQWRLHEQWKIRHVEQAVRDRANRRIAWRVVIVVALVLLAAIAFAGWELTRALAGHGSAILGGVVLVVAGCVLASALVGGGCKTVITIWHRH